MTTDKPAGEMPDVIKFLLGEGTLDGWGYGERPANMGAFWWRKALREAWETRTDKPDAAAAMKALVDVEALKTKLIKEIRFRPYKKGRVNVASAMWTVAYITAHYHLTPKTQEAEG